MTEAQEPSATPYLHVRPSGRVVGVGDRLVAKIYANKAGLRALRGQVDRALEIDEGMASDRTHYREADEAEFDLVVFRAPSRKHKGEPREPERPDYSRFT